MNDVLLSKLSRQIFSRTLKNTTVICRPKPPVVTPLGNGVMLDVNGTYYIISAGHLMNATDFSELLIPAANNKFAWCNGRLFTTFKSYADINKIDVAVFQFSNRQSRHISNHYSYIIPQQILLEHQPVETSSYIISGYPLNGIKKEFGKPLFVAEPLQVLTATVRKRTYKKFGFDKSTHILVKLHGRNKPFLSSLKMKIKNPRGISGSGLWYVPNWRKLDGNGVPEHYLVGILTENYIDKGFVAAIKIDFATEIIRVSFGINSKRSYLTNFTTHIKRVYEIEIP